MAVVGSAAEVRIERRGRAGFVVLDRPRALNALTLGMVRAIASALDDFERDPAITRVVVVGEGGKAFCAGGDIRKLYELGLAGDHAAQLDFWREEYILNRRIKRYPKPYLALIDGIVMGGGVGLSLHGAYRVATEKTVFAMPEVGIGFFPDVGATYLLPRAPHRIGVYLAITGLRANGADMAALGFASHYAASDAIPALARALEGEGDTQAILAAHTAPAPAAPLMADAEAIAQAFADLDADRIKARLERAAAAGAPFAERALQALATKSPMSQAIALRQMQRGVDATFERAMQLEYRIVSRICRGDDFYEGVRATIVDKDNRPLWRPAPGEALDPAAVEAHFAPLGAEDLSFGTPS